MVSNIVIKMCCSYLCCILVYHRSWDMYLLAVVKALDMALRVAPPCHPSSSTIRDGLKRFVRSAPFHAARSLPLHATGAFLPP